MASGYRDFIPEGEETGGAGAGFTDFIPPKQPKKEVKKPDAPKQDASPTHTQPEQSSRFRFPGQKPEEK